MKKSGANTPIKKSARMAYSCSCFLLYLGLDKNMKPMACIIYLLCPKTSKKNVDDLFEFGVLPEDPSFYLYRPHIERCLTSTRGHEGLYVWFQFPSCPSLMIGNLIQSRITATKLSHTLKEKNDFQ